MPGIHQFYQRINSKINLEELLFQAVSDFKLGKYEKWELIPFGYSDFNLKLYTDKKVYFVKIFSRNRSKVEINEIIHRFINLYKNNIPVPQLFSYNEGYLYSLNCANLIIMNFIDGTDFTNRKINISDIKKATEIIAKINNLTFNLRKSYDSWGTVNLITEFEKKKQYLSGSDLILVKKVISDYRKINFSKFQHSIIHGDFHGEHFLKDKKGKYWIIDVETMDIAPSVIDLAIFLATFPLNSKYSLGSDKKIFNLVISEYIKYKRLNKKEILSIPILINATYAIYLIRANYERIINHDQSDQTKYWLMWAKRGLISSI